MVAAPDSRALPELLHSEAELQEQLATPTPPLVDLMRRLEGDLLVLGAGGKMGASLCSLAVRAIAGAGVEKRVVAVSRFTDARSRRLLEDAGVETLPCDLLDPQAVSALPRLPNVIFMVGRKFGTNGDEAQTWASNVIVPVHVAHAFRESRMVVFSTGCVYPLVGAAAGGCTESCPPEPVGDYAQSCLGRERVFEYAGRSFGTPVCLMRLNYAIDLRYGVLHDIALGILSGRPIDLTVSAFNVIWQGDANERALRCLELAASPPTILNVTGPEIASTRETALALAGLLGREVVFTGSEAGARMYLGDATRSMELFGPPRVPFSTMLRWQAAWTGAGLPSLGKPTHFEVSDGRF